MPKVLPVVLCVFGIFLAFPLLARSQSATVEVPLHARTDRFIIQYKQGFSPDDLQEKIAARNRRKQTPLGAAMLRLEDLVKKKPEDTLIQIANYDRDQNISHKDKLFASTDSKLRQFYQLQLKNPSDRSRLQKVLRDYVKQGFIQAVIPDTVVTPPAITPNDTYFPDQWNLTRIAADEAWEIATGSSEIIVANIDSGIDYLHPDINPANVIMGYNYIQENTDPKDECGHGTSVHGIMGAVTNNGTGIAGINWNMKHMAIKIYDAGCVGYMSDLNQGIVYAADNGAKIVNLEIQSYAGETCTAADQAAIDYARSRGVIVIVPAGNFNGDVSNFEPPSCTDTIVVGATNETDQRATWGGGQASNYGAGVTISAPGNNTYSLKSNPCNAGSICYSPIGTHYQIFGGTSGAAPHVVGAVSLMLAVNPNLTQNQIKTYLVDNGDSISTDQPIGPRLNINRTLQAVQADMVTPTPVPSPTAEPSPTPIPTYSISGTIFNDTNYNGFQDGGETGSSGQTVNLSGAGSTATTTDASGNYQFTGLYAGSYTVTLTIPGGSVATTANPVTRDVSANTTVDFGIAPIPTYTVSGTVFDDANSDGVRDGGELGRNNVDINLSGTAVASATTDPAGFYQFPGLSAGPYTVTMTVPDGFDSTSTNPVDLTLSGDTSVDFGLAPEPTPEPTPIPTPSPTSAPTFSLSGTVYDDTNASGTMDGGELGYSGANLDLSGTATASATTDASGNYQFTNLSAGPYSLILSLPGGFIATTGNPVDITLSSGTSVHFGMYIPPAPSPSPTPDPTPTASPVPTPTPSPTPVPSTPDNSPPGILPYVPDLNFPIGFITQINSGPHYHGIQPAIIKGGAGAEGAEAIISPQSVHDDITVSVSFASPVNLILQKKIARFPWQQGFNTVGEIYEYRMTAAFNGMTISRFDKPVTIVVPYDPARLYGVRTSRLRVLTYDAKIRRWKVVPAPVVVNQKNHTLATTVSTFSYFTAGYIK